jgi:glutamate 5-kinase
MEPTTERRHGPSVDRGCLTGVRRLVVKVGTRVLSAGGRRFDESRLEGLVRQVAPLAREGREVLVVSSGAVGLGAEVLGLHEPPERLEDRQACAAVGQARLMQLYQERFRRHDVVCAQVLLTESDFLDRRRYLNLRATLVNLLRRRVVPIINENDTVSVDELVYLEQGTRPVFGDNDRLSALLATKLDAELLLIITDVGGVYDRDPKAHPDARLLDRVDDPDALAGLATGPTAAWGRGGMQSKIEAARVASRAGCHAIIASGSEEDPVLRALRGEPVGTWFPARDTLDARQRWIAFAARPEAVLHLDDGAVAALRDGKRSLLAAGVVRVEGKFRRGEVVELRAADGRLVGRGMTSCDVETARAWGAEGRRTEERSEQPLVRHERLVLEEWMSPGGAAAPPAGKAPAATGAGAARGADSPAVAVAGEPSAAPRRGESP